MVLISSLSVNEKINDPTLIYDTIAQVLKRCYAESFDVQQVYTEQISPLAIGIVEYYPIFTEDYEQYIEIFLEQQACALLQ